MRALVFSVLLIFICLSAHVSNAQDRKINIYLDADRSRHIESAKSIEMGIKTAFSEVGNVVQGYAVNFVALDHRGNSTRSKMNMDKAFSDPFGLLVVAGMHSPPLIKNRDYINKNKMLTLVPWAAGGPITRYPSSDNWVFRLSVDDTKAGYRIAHYAINGRECSRPHLLLERTPWGKSNEGTMSVAIQKYLKIAPSITWFNWGVSVESARIKLRAIVEEGEQCILFVGNANDGETFVKALLSLPQEKRLPVYSHWGITGGHFPETITAEMRKGLELAFIQSCFSFMSSEKTEFSKQVFSQAQRTFPSVKEPIDIQAPAGFVHAYDLGRLLIQAMSQVELSDDMVANRAALRGALEDLGGPVQGLVKTYDKPFCVHSDDNMDAHEALNIDDLCMARYGDDNEIIIISE